MREAADADPQTAQRKECEAAFYMGEIDLIADRSAEAKTRFQQASEICSKDSFEKAAAEAELGRL